MQSSMCTLIQVGQTSQDVTLYLVMLGSMWEIWSHMSPRSEWWLHRPSGGGMHGGYSHYSRRALAKITFHWDFTPTPKPHQCIPWQYECNCTLHSSKIPSMYQAHWHQIPLHPWTHRRRNLSFNLVTLTQNIANILMKPLLRPTFSKLLTSISLVVFWRGYVRLHYLVHLITTIL